MGSTRRGTQSARFTGRAVTWAALQTWVKIDPRATQAPGLENRPRALEAKARNTRHEMECIPGETKRGATAAKAAPKSYVRRKLASQTSEKNQATLF